MLPYGRAGLGPALDEALRILQQGTAPYVLVGGVDSYQQERLLSNLDADGRLATPDGPSDSFIPAEGAAWLCLSLAPSEAAVALSDWSLGEEPGHLYSQAPYTGSPWLRRASSWRVVCPSLSAGCIAPPMASGIGPKNWVS